VYRALLFDLDGTLTPVRSVWQHLHETLGLWEREARRHQQAFEEGSIDYAEFCARDAAHWKGLKEADLRAITDRIPYRAGAREAIAAACAAGAVVGVVSTGLTLLADRARAELGLEYCAANRLLARDGVLTGGVEIEVTHARKGDAVDHFCARFGIAPAEVVSFGDTDGDISMFERTGLSVAVFPASRRAAQAASRVHDEGRLDELVRGLPLGAPAFVSEGPYER
jgi:phosphoserine phosphatase